MQNFPGMCYPLGNFPWDAKNRPNSMLQHVRAQPDTLQAKLSLHNMGQMNLIIPSMPPKFLPTCHQFPLLPNATLLVLTELSGGDDDDDDCGYDGGVSTFFSDNDEYAPDGDSDSEFTESDLSDFDEDILETLKTELASLAKPATVNDALGKSKSKKDWKKAEANRSLGYNGLSIRTIQRHAKDARDRETHREEVEKS
ncbi:hypothetical protein C8J57DRAFT_1228787 [Mycena rebaudengoi]|nr:hypothetical protein C8J57DRAFT_1228787 [Mycena rebaudengoi]